VVCPFTTKSDWHSSSNIAMHVAASRQVRGSNIRLQQTTYFPVTFRGFNYADCATTGHLRCKQMLKVLMWLDAREFSNIATELIALWISVL
jgi:hypothetical protein